MQAQIATITYPACIIETTTGRRFAIFQQRPVYRVSRFTKQGYYQVTGQDVTADGNILIMNTRIPIADIKRIVCLIDHEALRQQTLNYVHSAYDLLSRRLANTA